MNVTLSFNNSDTGTVTVAMCVNNLSDALREADTLARHLWRPVDVSIGSKHIYTANPVR